MTKGSGHMGVGVQQWITSPEWNSEVAKNYGGTVFVLLHGYGADESDLTDVGPSLIQLFGVDYPWVSLRGPLSLPQGGAAWLPLTTVGHPDGASVLRATAELWDWVDNHVPAASLFPIGFSQGAVMASQLLRTRPERVSGLAILSGFVVPEPQVADGELAQTRPRVFWGRGLADPVIGEQSIHSTTTWLAAHSTPTICAYPGLGHGISSQEIADLADYGRQVLTGER